MSKRQIPYLQRIKKLFVNFRELLAEIDSLLVEQEEKFQDKESRINQLEKQEQELAKKINRLRQSPQYGIVMMHHQLRQLIMEQEQDSKRGIQRDYVLFVLSIITPFIITWILRLLGYNW